MKAIIILITILSLGLAISGQNPSKDEKKLAKEQAKIEKQRAEADAKSREAEAAKKTVNLNALETFPSEYMDKVLRVQAVRLDEIKPYSEGANTAYLMALSNNNASTMAFPLNGRVTFIMETWLAKAAFEEIGDLPDGYKKIVDVWFETKSIPDERGAFYFAKVQCIVFRVYGNAQPKVLGTCPSQ